MEMLLRRFDLPLRHVFTIARGSVAVQPTLIVELSQEGCRGYGEATTSDYYGFTYDNMTSALERVRPLLASHRLEDPAAFWEQAAEPLADNPFALCALDQAAHDLWGKLRGQPVYRLWGLSRDHNPVTNYTIGIDTIDVMVNKMREFPDWPVYKIKLGTDHDLEIVRELRRHTTATFRVDANCAWDAEQTIHNAAAMKPLGVEFIEQPLPPEQWDAMVAVHRKSVLPVIADESCRVESDVPRCHGRFHGINIKLVKCGGMTPARRMIAEAQRLGMKVMIGCMTESTVGISAIAQLLPLLDYVDMDGALLLARDVARGITIDNGVCHYPDVAGNGVTLL